MESEEMSFKEKDLQFYFVIKKCFKDIDEVSTDMTAAFANIREYFDEDNNINWIKEEDCLQLSKENLTKRDIFILQDFSGEAFEFLQNTKSLTIGPRCMLSSLIENTTIPLGTKPIFTTAMLSLNICVSGLLPKEKSKIYNLVSWMAGKYSDSLSVLSTHLISNTVKSEKYEKAAIRNIPIMHVDWVHQIWERSQNENILATSQEFDKYKLQIFHSLNVTTSGLTAQKKDELKKLIIDNGGIYVPTFRSGQTDILIIEKSKVGSDKYQAAIKYKKECLLPDWIYDSVTKGYALPTKNYKVVKIKVSTPTKLGNSINASDFNPDGTQLSEISVMNQTQTSCTINETALSLPNSAKSQPNNNGKQRKSYKLILNEIDTRQAKKAGTFLDGCSIFLCGFTSDEKDKINKIINMGGATRFNEINDKVTHIIVGEPNPAEIKQLKGNGILSATLLKIDWLLESIKQKQPVDENEFIYYAKLPIVNEPEQPSPSSKKSIQRMNHSFKKPLSRTKLDFTDTSPSTSKRQSTNKPNSNEHEENHLLGQYQQQNLPELPAPSPQQQQQKQLPSSSMTKIPKFPNQTNTETEPSGYDSELCTADLENLNFLIDHKMFIYDHEYENYIQSKDDCETAGGHVVDENYKGIIDYIIVSPEMTTDLRKIPVKGKYIVNNLWLEDSIKTNQRVNIEYYHQPIPITADKAPLKGITIVISNYSASERIFIEILGQILGTEKNNSYVKKERPLLICPVPEGAKYNGAIRWGFPIVTSEWLVECAKQGTKIDMNKYLVGDISPSTVAKWNLAIMEKLSTTGSNENVMNTSQINKVPIKSNDLIENNIPLKHPRLSQLSDTIKNIGNCSISNTPPSSPCFNMVDMIKDMSTPKRDLINDILKERENKETPRSQRIRDLIATPGTKAKSPATPNIPDFVTTPEIQKRRLGIMDSYYLPQTKRERRQSTPLSEIKKRFWKEALGDNYVEYKQYETQSTQFYDSGSLSKARRSDEQGTSKDQDCGIETQKLISTNFHVKQLSDFIKNRETSNKYNIDDDDDDCEETEAIPEKYEPEIMCTGNNDQMVGWRDPSEFIHSHRSKTVKYKFTISCAVAPTQNILEQIKQLKGETCENIKDFDPTCTHIICEIPNRGEKILSGIASGKWILGLQYIEDSFKSGYFLDEELYEWGNPLAAKNLPDINDDLKTIANSSYKWRKKIQINKCGAFNGLRMILHLSKRDIFQRLIEVGGGKILDVHEPYWKSEEALQATHCIVEDKKMLLSRKDHKALAESGVLVLSFFFLRAHLITDNPDTTKFILPL